jgi:peptide deformylase
MARPQLPGSRGAGEPDDSTRRAAAFERIRQWGDPVLRTPARPVEVFDAALAEQAQDMIRLMDAAHGAGLAAPQIGLLQRLLVYYAGADEPPRALVNPVIESASTEQDIDLEGCLSLGRAGVYVEVPRAIAVVVTGNTVDGEGIRIEAEGGHARVLQHEIDHLDGVLMLARTAPAHRRAAIRALNAGEPWQPEPTAAPDDGDPPGA